MYRFYPEFDVCTATTLNLMCVDGCTACTMKLMVVIWCTASTLNLMVVMGIPPLL